VLVSASGWFCAGCAGCRGFPRWRAFISGVSVCVEVILCSIMVRLCFGNVSVHLSFFWSCVGAFGRLGHLSRERYLTPIRRCSEARSAALILRCFVRGLGCRVSIRC